MDQFKEIPPLERLLNFQKDVVYWSTILCTCLWTTLLCIDFQSTL